MDNRLKPRLRNANLLMVSRFVADRQPIVRSESEPFYLCQAKNGLLAGFLTLKLPNYVGT
jgi:hypothetical protein